MTSRLSLGRDVSARDIGDIVLRLNQQLQVSGLHLGVSTIFEPRESSYFFALPANFVMIEKETGKNY